MKFLLLAFFISFSSQAALTKASCKTKVKAAVLSETGYTVQEGSFNVLLALCEGIIEEIQQNAVVVPGTFQCIVGGVPYPVTNTGKIQ